MKDILHPLDSFGIMKVSLSNIRIEKLEDRVKPGVPFPHKHDFYQIMIVTSGKGLHKIDFIEHEVSPQQIFLMKPGQMHSWTLKKGIRGFIVEFHPESLSSFKENAKLVNDLSFSPDMFFFKDKNQFQDLILLTELMDKEFHHYKPRQDLCLQAYLTSFLVLIVRTIEEKQKLPKAMTVIEKFRAMVEKNYRNQHAVEFYAKELKTSSQALTMQISRALGKPPRLIIQERLLLEAKRYLAFSDLGVAEIGYELGFDDANYFTRFFRTHEKITPAQFRKKG